jgi:hypothetical protein
MFEFEDDDMEEDLELAAMNEQFMADGLREGAEEEAAQVASNAEQHQRQEVAAADEELEDDDDH